MRKKFAIIGLLLAWLCANGALLDVVQVFAWGRMFADYKETMSVAEALRETFDPTKPCELCVSVADAKSTERQQREIPLERLAEKIVLVCETTSVNVPVQPIEPWLRVPAIVARERADTVPVPPPRTA